MSDSPPDSTNSPPDLPLDSPAGSPLDLPISDHSDQSDVEAELPEADLPDVSHENSENDFFDDEANSNTEEDNLDSSKPDDGTKKDGCKHYVCRCAYVSPCCNKIYTCRICHDEAEAHEIIRFNVVEIVCLVCSTRQPVGRTCEKCLIEFGHYFCAICRMFDDNDKKQFHCDPCGICRVGGRENYFHCLKCDMCLQIDLKNSHKCVEKVTRSNCPVCLEDLHTSRMSLSVLPCGHVFHQKCFRDLLKTGNYTCPLCCQSMCDMSSAWQELDEELAETSMPPEYVNQQIWILCRDCHKVGETLFHVIGLKCNNCGSYNTCRTENPSAATADKVVENDPNHHPESEDPNGMAAGGNGDVHPAP